MSDHVRWSQEEDLRLARMWLAQDPPASVREAADALEKSKSATYRRLQALGYIGHKGDRAKYEAETGVALDPVIKPVRVDTPARPTGQSVGSDYTMLIWGDVHYPFQDDAAVDVLRQVARDLQPDKLVCIGDIFDFYEISDYRPPRDEEPDIQETLNAGVQHLADMLELAEPSEAYFLAGNHEDRWDRMLLKARRDVRFRQLLRLPKIRRSLDFQEVVGFESLGYDYRPYVEGVPLIENDKLVITHGDRANKYVSRSMLEKYGKNVIFGHKHQIQSWTKRDLKGQEAAWCIGCLSVLDPHYDSFANWQHGFAVVTWHDGLFDVEQVRIHDGRTIWRGRSYTAG